jgi:hypothetical protein
MNPQVIIITQKNDPSVNNLIHIIKEKKITNYILLHSRKQLNEIDHECFRGFFIFCLPPSEARVWIHSLDEKFLDYFKIYNYNYLVEGEIDNSLFLNFDFIVAGEQENGILNRQLEFLKSNYWRKIPISKFGLKIVQDSGLISRFFKILETTDINMTSIDQVSKKLDVSKETLRKEIRKKLHLHYSELTIFLLDYYQEVYPD